MYSQLLHHAAMPALLRMTRSRFWAHYRRMLRLERKPLEQLRSLQWNRFQALLKHACEQVPYYRDRSRESGLRPHDIASPDDIPRLAILTKRQIQRHFPDGITAENTHRDDWQYVSTRGTADRLMAIHDFAKRDTVRAAAVRAADLGGGYRVGMKSVEIPPNICNIVCGDEGEPMEGVLRHAWNMTRSGTWRDRREIGNLRGLIERRWIYRRRTYPPFGTHGTNLPQDQLREYIDRLQRDRPYMLKALPTYLLQIARHVTTHHLEPLPVRIIKPMGASVSMKMRQFIQAGFTGQYREDYGSAEFGDMACDCDQRDGLHIFMDLFLIEIVRGGRPVPDGELGKILITDLSNFAMPMIRYEIGDVGRIVCDACPCGRAAPRLYVEGRLQDTIVSQTGAIVTNDQLMNYFYSREDTDQFQLCENQPGRMELIVVPANGHSPDPTELKRDLGTLFQHQIDLAIHPVKTIPAEASGKFRFVKSASYQRLG